MSAAVLIMVITLAAAVVIVLVLGVLVYLPAWWDHHGDNRGRP